MEDTGKRATGAVNFVCVPKNEKSVPHKSASAKRASNGGAFDVKILSKKKQLSSQSINIIMEENLIELLVEFILNVTGNHHRSRCCCQMRNTLNKFK